MKKPLSESEPLDDHAAGGEQDGALREQRQEGEQRHVDRALPEGADGCVEDRARGALEL